MNATIGWAEVCRKVRHERVAPIRARARLESAAIRRERNQMNDKLYDVVGVNIETSAVRIMRTEMTHENADAFVKMAVMRRGVDEEFFSEVIHGQYKDGDKWEGNDGVRPYEPETAGDPPRIQKIGNMWYPIGPRGLDR